MKPTEEVRIWNNFVTSSFEEHYHCKATTAEFALSEAIDLNGGVQFSNLALLSHAVQWRQEICWYSFLFLFSFFFGGGLLTGRFVYYYDYMFYPNPVLLLTFAAACVYFSSSCSLQQIYPSCE